MIKPFTIICLLVFAAAFTAKAQTAPADSITKIARADAKNFRLNKQDFKKFRKDRRNANSDYFKPARANVSNAALLGDSVYVKAYRAAAYAKTRHRHTTGHYVLLGGIALTVVALVAVAAATNSVLTGYH
ncbi:MAG: hypothetical protein JST19_17470 [Bacteroidetes bacterium]|nr:hypothetical protein [Bacteroidota bacterium]